MKKRTKRKILKTYVDNISMEETIEKILGWSLKQDTKYISVTDTNVLVKSWLDPKYREATNTSDLSPPDGAPLALILRLFGFKGQKRVTGPDLMEKIIPILIKNKLRILFYGSTNFVLEKISSRIKDFAPNADLYFESPPFRALTKNENSKILKSIKKFNPHVIFVGLGCPKQDFWIYENKKKINAVFIAIGAGFDFYSGNIKRAPKFFQNNGLEWFYRVYKNPKRLSKRYIINFFIFPIGLFIQLFQILFQKLAVKFK